MWFCKTTFQSQRCLSGATAMDNRYIPRSPMARSLTRILILLFVLLTGFLIFYYNAPIYSFTTYSPEQPITYSHKLHAGELGIDCQFCHIFARRSEMAGVPSLSKCMGCHNNMSIESTAITALLKHDEDQKPIEWVRIYDLPDHVWFSHKRHVKASIRCQQCHGSVETLVRNARLIEPRMGFCLDCHQKRGAPTDCWTCHT